MISLSNSYIFCMIDERLVQNSIKKLKLNRGDLKRLMLKLIVRG